jgi:hypothetical protein
MTRGFRLGELGDLTTPYRRFENYVGAALFGVLIGTGLELRPRY